MRFVAFALAGVVALAGCHGSADVSGARGNDQTVRIALDGSGGDENVSVAIPGFNARLGLPAMDLARHVDLHGIRLAPGTRIMSVDIDARDGDAGDRGKVLMAFASPQSPADLIDYYRRQAAEAGYGGVAPSADGLSATRGDKRFAVALSSAGAGSKGTITISGG